MTRFIIALYHPNGSVLRNQHYETANPNLKDALMIKTGEVLERWAVDSGYSVPQLEEKGFFTREFVEFGVV